MKINTKALLDTGGFSCTSLAFNEETGGYAECEARAVFITEETVAGARAAQADMPPVDPSRLPDLRYGDVLVSRAHPDGRKEGLHIPAGRDAGLVIAVLSADGSSQNIPFTGSHMLAARQRLLAMSARGEALSGDQEKILAGVQGVLEIVAARPDPKRFSGDLIGKAFMCSLIDRPNRIELSISDAEFGRKARADMIRAQIAHLSPDHPDGLSPAAAASLDELLREVGVQTGADAIREVGGISITEETIRGMVAANPQFCTDVFGSITATPVHRLSAAAITSGEYDLLADELSEHVLTGSWVKRRTSGPRKSPGPRRRVTISR